MEFEEKFGVKVEVNIPLEDRTLLYEQWRRWLAGEIDRYATPRGPGLMTRYEHFILVNEAGLPPDPFKPLAAFAKGADLDGIIKARRRDSPPGQEYEAQTYSRLVPNLEEITGLKPSECRLVPIYPEISQDGRVDIPQIVGIVNSKGERIEVNDNTLAKVQLPRETVRPFGPNRTMIKEVFDYHRGYRIELAPTPSP